MSQTSLLETTTGTPAPLPEAKAPFSGGNLFAARPTMASESHQPAPSLPGGDELRCLQLRHWGINE